MSKHKYYDFTNNRPINLNSDGCALAEWRQRPKGCHFAKHPRGFKVFLPPDKIEACDEYAESDPYTVEQNLDGSFHSRRVELTVDLIRDAVGSLQDTPRILDLGCGQGHITEKIRQSLDRAEITGLDYSVSAIEYAHEHFPEIDFAVGDAYNNPYSPGYFDVVICNNLWEHVPDPLHLLSRIKRTIKPGGYLIISTPSRYRIGNLIRVLRGKPVTFMSKHHVTEYTVGQVKEQLGYGGFEVKEVKTKPIPAWSIKMSIARSIFSRLISMLDSHHQLESTVFYLAKEVATDRPQDIT
ncbi:MAG: class I SAM-dependent methyltransferase [Thioalkalispiraceae bacterium]|jgi:2-polyprenyl-3-methyl-5-hydroxy-6-metoxy-1,4-benzoquinol methylase